MWETILLTTALTVAIFLRMYMPHHSRNKARLRLKKKSPEDIMADFWQYESMKKMIHENKISLPAMIVDLDILDHNIKQLVRMVEPTGKTIRIATKSIRCPDLIKRILDKGKGVIKGLMCYSVQEAAFLATAHGMDDFFVPYPTMQRYDLETAVDLTQKGKVIVLTVACVEDVVQIDETLEQIISEKYASKKKSFKIKVAVDLDMAFYLGPIRLGAHRSNCRSVEQFAIVIEAIQQSKNLVLAGIMGYEAHVAGLPDANPHSPIPNFIVRFLKKLFFKQTVKFRRQIAQYCLDNQLTMSFFNGSGSGNLREASVEDDVITEVTAGSAFLQGQLFDYFDANSCTGAFCFALQATRVHYGKNYICCQSGGFIASGPKSGDKNPVAFGNPFRLEPFSDEGFGEVQTPLSIKGKTGSAGCIGLGDPVFFRPAKSGEIAEHFKEYHLKKDYKIVGTAQTYRGHGEIFY